MTIEVVTTFHTLTHERLYLIRDDKTKWIYKEMYEKEAEALFKSLFDILGYDYCERKNKDGTTDQITSIRNIKMN